MVEKIAVKVAVEDTSDHTPKPTNLLMETLKSLEMWGKSPDEVEFISINGRNPWTDGYLTWEEFAALAEHVEYEQQRTADYKRNEYWKPVIDDSLRVVGKNWWLERENEDMASGVLWETRREGWLYYEMPEKPSEHSRRKSLLTK